MPYRSILAAAVIAFAAPLAIPAASAGDTAKPAATKPAAAKPAAKPSGPRGPRTAKSLACSKDADAKKLHGAARTSFMRSCNKG